MYGCICPHPPLLIPEIGGTTLSRVQSTVEGMRRLAADIGEIDTAVVISPHTSGTSDTHVVKSAPHLSGDFGRFGCPDVAFGWENDIPFVELLLALAPDHDVRLATGNDVLDWGVLVPMSFLSARRLVSLSVVDRYSGHRDLGRLVRRCAGELGRDVVFVASGDLSHRLTPSAPAGYDPRGHLFDERLVELLRAGDFAGLPQLEPELVVGAGECGLRSFYALGGFLGEDAVAAPNVYSYEGPFGVGYLVAGFATKTRGSEAT